MTPLALDAPLASLLVACEADGRKLSQRDLGEAREPPVAQASVANAVEAGSRIKLSTLAAYARAAGYALWMYAHSADGTRGTELDDELPISVAAMRAALALIGMTMTLAVEPAEGSGSCGQR